MSPATSLTANRGTPAGRAIRPIVVLGVVALLLSGVPQLASAAPDPESGIVCTEGPSFELTATAGFVGIPDGNSILMWSYAPGDATTAAFQLPGPVLCVDEGDTVSVTLDNELPEAVSISFPGQDGVTADGFPVEPQFDGGGILVGLTQAAAPGGSITYSFVASHPGTYLYQSGTNPQKQVQMGLYGALVVRSGDTATAYGAGTDSEFNLDTEYVILMSEVDPDLHQAVERGLPYRPADYHPRYWMMNGRSFPDTIAPNGATWLPSQPYSSFVHMHPLDASNPLPALVRYLNVGTRSHPFHPHGNHGRIIARDGRLVSPVDEASGIVTDDLTNERYLINVGPGQTWDVLYTWANAEGWNPDTNPLPIPLPQQQDTTYKDDVTWYAGSPYLGYQDELPSGVTSFNQCGEYYIIWHSHALNEAANYDAGFGGMITLQRIDPPAPNTCGT